MKKNLLFEDILRTVSRYFVVIIIAVVLIICCSGIRFIKSGESAIILRFGKIVGDTPEEQVHDAGILFAFPYIIDEVITVPTGSVQEFTVNTHYTSGEMTTYDRNGYVITGDNSIAILSASVKYTISDPVAYALAVKDPQYIINAVVSNAMINVAANYAVDDILTTGKDAYTKEVHALSQEKLDENGIGVTLSHFELTRVGMPEEVRDIYELVNSTNIQASTRIEQARQYYETRIPGAEAEAAALISEAHANYSNFTAAANSDLYEFYGVLDEYNANPDIVRIRLYNTAISNIIRQIGTVKIVDDSDSKIIIN
ncbi:MAG: protease modulator HflK [Clostridia bacterium]|nr:protease modulator HflK [Clostridia bacterium]